MYIDERERRELRERAVSHAAYLHSDINLVFEREDQITEVLKTAQEFYDWIIIESEERQFGTGAHAFIESLIRGDE